MDINVREPFVAAKAAIPNLPQGDRIIAIESTLGERVASPGKTAYAMSKSALLSFTRGLSRELGRQGITVNAQPGSTNIEASPADSKSDCFQRSLSLMGRYSEPRETTSAVLFLAGPAVNMMMGGVLNVRRHKRMISRECDLLIAANHCSEDGYA